MMKGDVFSWYNNSMKKIVLWLIYLYQAAISPFVGHCCRFFPTCSDYAIDAVKKYGVFKGLWLALRRVGRCHPFHRGGHDPIP